MVFRGTRHAAGGLYAHLTWRTKKRMRVIAKIDVPIITAAINEAAARTDARVLGIGILKNHVHIVLRHSPDKTLTGFIRHAKSESARRVNMERAGEQVLKWARGYYAGSVSRSHLEQTRNYVGGQYKRHPDLIPE